MAGTNEFEQFARRICRVFTSEVNERGRSRADQVKWWEQYYCHRPEKHEEFVHEFLENPTRPICRIVGQIGAGKTTYVLAVLQHPVHRVADGIRIDIAQYAGRLHGAHAAATRLYDRIVTRTTSERVTLTELLFRCVSPVLNTIIVEEVERVFRQHCWWIHTGLARHLYRTDVSLRLDAHCTEATQEQRETVAGNVHRDVAAALMLVRTDDWSISVREKAFKQAGDEIKSSSVGRFEAVRNYLQSHSEDCIRARGTKEKKSAAETVARWLRAYADFFGHNKILLVFDNVDWVYSTLLHRAIGDYAATLAGELYRKRQPGDVSESLSDQRPFEVKVVYTIRDWNMRASAAPFMGGNQPYSFSVTADGQGHGDSSLTKAFVPLDRTHLLEIIESRLSTAESVFKGRMKERYSAGTSLELLAQFGKVVQRLWVHGDLPSEEVLTLEEVTNGSIRSALSMSCNVAIQLLRTARGEKRDLDLYLSSDYRLALRPRVINWFFDPTETGRELSAFINEAMRLVEARTDDYLCCAHRIILTYLYRLRETGISRVKVGELLEHLRKHVLLNEDKGREALFFLFQPGDIQADFVTIYQKEPINEEKDISFNAQIRINPRGQAYVEKLMTRLEYWARLAAIPDPNVSLYECKPEQASVFLKPILTVVRTLSEAHKHNWMKLVAHHKKRLELQDDDVPFDVFSRAKLSFGKAFYLHRVSNSAMHSVISYFRALFQDDPWQILLPAIDQAEFQKRWPPMKLSPSEARMQDASALRRTGKRYCQTLPVAQQRIIQDLLNIATGFDEIRTEWNTLKGMTIAEVQAVKPSRT